MITLVSRAQQPAGTVNYQEVEQLHMEISDDQEMSRVLPKSHTDHFVLLFGNNQSVWKPVEESDATSEVDGEGEGMHIRFMVAGQSDITFCDFTREQKIEQREIFDKKYIVTDSIRKLTWKLTGKTKTILNHLCQQAVAQKAGKSMQMNINNGVMDKKEVPDTSTITAWFTMDIPVSAGPEYPGELPGLILELDMNNGNRVYTATGISGNVDPSQIKAPEKGKKLTPAQFATEREKLMEEMQKNSGEGGERKGIIKRD